MAQSGYTPILIYASGTATNVPLAANMTSSASGAELALNYTDGKLYYKDNAGVVKLLASNATSAPVLTFSAGTTGFTPSSATSGAVTLAGTLITSNGGTGLSSYTAGDLSYYASGTALTKLAIGTAGQFLTSTGTAPQWSTLSGVAVTTFSAGTTGFTPSSATAGAVTLAGTLATTNGGTGLTSFTANGVVYASSTSALTTGSSLTYDGTTFQQSVAGLYPLISVASSANSAILGFRINNTGTGGVDWRMEEGRSAVGEFNITNITQSNTVVFKISTTGNASTFASSLIASQFIPTSSSVPSNGMYLPSANNVGFAINSAEAMRLNSTGLGIGTNSPQAKLELYSNADANFGIKIYHTSVALAAQRYPQIELAHTPVAQGYQNKVFLRYQNSVSYGNYPSFAIITDAAGAGENTRMFLDGFNGYLGINTTQPNEMLQIDSGNIRLQGANPGQILFFSTGNGVSQNATLAVQNDGATTNTGEFRFSTRNQAGTLAERVRILAGGAFLVGQTSTVNGSGASLQGNLATGAVGVSGSFATVWTIPSGTQGIFTVSMGGNGQYGGGMLFFVSYGQFPAGGNAYVVALAGPGGDQSGYGYSWQLASGGQFQMRNNTNTVPFVPAISMLTLA